MKGISAQNRRQNRVLAVSLSTILLAGVLTGAHASRVCYLLNLIQVPVCGLQQLRHGPAVLRRSTHSNTDGEWRLFAALPQCLLHALRNTIANSSPPYRAARSVARECSLITSDNLLSARFPARCPYLSLITFSTNRDNTRGLSSCNWVAIKLGLS
jgi:hypothetical protein